MKEIDWMTVQLRYKGPANWRVKKQNYIQISKTPGALFRKKYGNPIVCEWRVNYDLRNVVGVAHDHQRNFQPQFIPPPLKKILWFFFRSAIITFTGNLSHEFVWNDQKNMFVFCFVFFLWYQWPKNKYLPLLI